MRSLLDEEEQPEIVGTITICLFVSYIGNPFKVDISLSVCILRFIIIDEPLSCGWNNNSCKHNAKQQKIESKLFVYIFFNNIVLKTENNQLLTIFM